MIRIAFPIIALLALGACDTFMGAGTATTDRAAVDDPIGAGGVGSAVDDDDFGGAADD